MALETTASQVGAEVQLLYEGAFGLDEDRLRPSRFVGAVFGQGQQKARESLGTRMQASRRATPLTWFPRTRLRPLGPPPGPSRLAQPDVAPLVRPGTCRWLPWIRESGHRAGRKE